MSTAVGIVAVPERWTAGGRLARKVGSEVLVTDVRHHGERWCHQETLARLIDTGADWLVWLEDDALPCPRFRERLSDSLDSAGDALVSLYLGTGRWAGTSPARMEPVVRGMVERAESGGSRWIETDALWHAVAVAVPAYRAGSLLAHLRADPRPTDQAATRWARTHFLPVRYTWPSLVDHDDSLPRIVRTSDRPVPRRAWRVEV